MSNELHSSENTGLQNWKTAAGVLGVLFIAAMIFGGISFSKYRTSVNKATDLGAQLDQTRTTLEGELAVLNTAYSDQIAMNDTLSSELQIKIAEVEDLQIRIDKARKDLKASQANAAQIKTRLAQMEELKMALEQDIINLRGENEMLVSSNQQLNVELASTREEVSMLSSQVLALTTANERLTSRLTTLAPAGFRADNFTVTASTKKDKQTNKAKKIDEVKVTFDLNNIPEEYQGSREIYLVLTEFNGNPVSGVAAKDVQLKIGNEPVLVKAADVHKANLKARQSMTMSFEPQENLNPGTYNVMVYADNGYLGSTGFLVSK
jgi:outer membrane murein-binding lipoprotein Lpp